MAARSLHGWILVAMAVLAIFAGYSATAMGQSQGASFHIVNDGAPGSILGTGVKVHCFDTSNPNDLPITTLLPGQVLYQTWPYISFLGDVYQCDFELDAPSGTLTQSFIVWKQVSGSFTWFLNGCLDCKWSIVPDGFYWYDDFQRQWVKEESWIS